MTAENPNRRGLFGRFHAASMRPRPMTAENPLLQYPGNTLSVLQ